MTKSEIKEFLLKLENDLIKKAECLNIKINRNWVKQFPSEAAVYLFREKGKICYIGKQGTYRDE